MKKYLVVLLLVIFPFLLIRSLPLIWLRYLVATTIVVYLFYRFFREYDFKQLGFFKPTKKDYLYLAFASLVLLASFLIIKLPGSCPPEPLGFPERTPAWLLLLVYGVANALGQEIVYRSFLVNYLEETLKRRELVLLVGAALFSLLHIPWQTNFVLGSLLVGFYFVWWFMQTRNIVLIMILHIPMTVFVIYSCYL